MSESHHVVTTCDRCGKQNRASSTSHTCQDPQHWFTISHEYQDGEGKWQFSSWHLCPECGENLLADLIAPLPAEKPEFATGGVIGPANLPGRK